jgi:tetratricopeptide (TPR) repeat protein
VEHPLSRETIADLHEAAEEARRMDEGDAARGARLAACEGVLRALAAWDEGEAERAVALLDGALAGACDPRLLFLGFQFHFRLGDYARAERYVRARLAVHEGDSAEAARAWNNLGLIEFFRENDGASEAHFRRALAIDTALGHGEGIARDLGNLALISERRGDLDAAERLYTESLAIAERVNAKAIVGTKLANLGDAALARGDRARAREMWERALGIFRELGDAKNGAYCERSLAGLG